MYIVLAGDFNNKNIDEAIGDYADITVTTSGATRASATLDLTVTSFNFELIGVSSRGPLDTKDGRKSDHDFISYDYSLTHRHEFKWI